MFFFGGGGGAFVGRFGVVLLFFIDFFRNHNFLSYFLDLLNTNVYSAIVATI